MLKLKLQYFGHLMWRANSLEQPWFWERLKAGGEGNDRGWDAWMASLTHRTWVWASSRRWWRTGKPGVLQSLGSQRVRQDWATEEQQQEAGRFLLWWFLFLTLSGVCNVGCKFSLPTAASHPTLPYSLQPPGHANCAGSSASHSCKYTPVAGEVVEIARMLETSCTSFFHL